MYRVNVERSQEKNDRSGGARRCTKVTSRIARAEKVCMTSPLALIFSTKFAAPGGRKFHKAFCCGAGTMARGEPWRRVAQSIMRDDFWGCMAWRSAFMAGSNEIVSPYVNLPLGLSPPLRSRAG